MDGQKGILDFSFGYFVKIEKNRSNCTKNEVFY